MTNSIGDFQEYLKDYLTFYHECLIPKHDFFTSEKNRNNTDEFIVVSSPSRMGNHALLSMLDSHPEIPRVPGEDSFLRHTFFQCSDDLQAYLTRIRGADNVEFIRMLSSFPATVDKWEEVKKTYVSQVQPKVYAGIQYPTNRLVVTDYQDTLIDIQHDAYVDYLESVRRKIAESDNYSELFLIYLSALMQLDFEHSPGRFAGIYANSGMRRQCLWLCQNFANVKILTSIRRFETYAISHIRSRYKTVEFRPEYIKEAWDHWYHKVVDYYYIKSQYPEKIMLIPFEDISQQTQLVADHLADFLHVDFHPNMLKATIFGVETKGNSSKRKKKSDLGKFYTNFEKMPEEYIPERARTLQNALEMVKYNHAAA